MFGKKNEEAQNNVNKEKNSGFEEIKNTKTESELNKEMAETTDNNEAEKKEETKVVQEENNEILKLKEENQKLKDTLMRTLAELENTRRRAGEENEKMAKYAISKFAEDLIPVMENFYLAFKNAGEDGKYDENKAKIFFDGIKLTQNELKKVFDKNGLVRVFPMNEKFNPDFHNAISQIESDKEEGIIVDVMQSGYTIKDRLLRPALVIVSKGKN